MVGEKRAAEHPAEEGLKTDPLHQAVKICLLCVEICHYLVLPVGLCRREGLLYFGGGIIFFKYGFNGLFLVFYTKKEDKINRFAGCQSNLFKPESAHGFPAFCAAESFMTGIGFIDSAGM